MAAWRRFLALLAARNREFVRDRAALSWNLLFPALIVAGFAFAFAGEPVDRYQVGIHGEPGADLAAFTATDYIRFIQVDDLDEAVTKVERHRLDLVVDAGAGRYWVNETNPGGHILERVLAGTSTQALEAQAVSGAAIRYVDWVVPGVLAMNMMFSALYGVGYVIVRYRKNGVLKRLKATPLNAFEFLAAQVVSRLLLLLTVTIAVYVATDLFIDFRMYGRYLDLLVVYGVGAFSVVSLGLLIASRTASEELAGGLVNLIAWPMMFLSGVWFSLEGLNPLVQTLSLALPLTHLLDAARAIMFDGAGLVDVAGDLALLVAMSGLFLAVGARAFRWE